MLLNTFYSIAESAKEGSTISARLNLNPEHEIFKGHFPSRPIVPGVCLIQMIEEILSKIVGKNLMVTSAAQIKFLSFVAPSVNRQLDLRVLVEKEDNGLMAISANYFWQGTIFLKFKGELQ